jgi:hypothetical protein
MDAREIKITLLALDYWLMEEAGSRKNIVQNSNNWIKYPINWVNLAKDRSCKTLCCLFYYN